MRTRWLLLIAAATALVSDVSAQKFDDFGRERGREMLRNIAEDVKKRYYDPTYHGLDFDAQVRDADENLQRATSVTETYRIVAGVLGGLNDSGTYFVPPLRGYRAEYGWQMQMVGSHCYVTRVVPKSDAEAKGLKPGDEIIAINGSPVSRQGFRTLAYILYVLSPQPEVRMQILKVDGQQSELKIAAKVVSLKMPPGSILPRAKDAIQEWNKEKKRNRPRCESVGDALEVCKAPDLDIQDAQIDEILNLARTHPACILDLRGNRYGTTQALKRLAGGLFDHEVKIGERTGRAGTKLEVASPRHDAFSGKLVVLVDSQTSSAAELFARIVQLEKRGVVMGDRSAGAVRESRRYEYHFPTEPREDLAIYEAMITESDMVMADGQSLENKGVVPDEIVLPNASAIAGGYDPLLAHAAERLGVKLSPDQAGKLLPYDWPKE